ncbi:reverse transcriptase domain-containing protein [Tanacetum coccineum]
MAQWLRTPHRRYEDAIVVPAIIADNFELKHSLAYPRSKRNQIVGHDKETLKLHNRYSNKITSTMKYRTSRNSLNSAAGGNFLDKMPRDCLRIIESKSKVRNSRNKPVVAKVSASSSTPGISPDVAELKDMVKALLLDKKNQSQTPAPAKAVEESCVTCGSGTLPSNTITNLKVDLKGITTRSGAAYQGPTIPTTSSSPPKVVERETEVTKDSCSRGGSRTEERYYTRLGIILLHESFSMRPSLPPPTQGNYLPEIQKELKVCEAKTDKSSIDEPSPRTNSGLPPSRIRIFGGLIYPISDSPWVSLVHCVPKKGGFTIVENDENELIHTRLVTGWCVCIDYRKLNEATRKDHFPLPFMDQMLERLAGNEYYCFLDGFSGYFQIPIDPHDQEKTTFTCPYGTFAYRRMPFGLCNAPGMFQRCIMDIFQDMIEKTMEVFMDDFSVFGNSFRNCLSRVDKMLKRCEETNFCLNWEKSHFMVKEGIVLGHKISKNEIEVDKAKVDVIAKLPHPTTVKGVRSFLGHAGFYHQIVH